ncbi:MAG TPA: ThuA domain-containing protein [Planctomycetota bacterium]|jgi:type 1 glutamine amidotransferase|nr:ThuA domain-containing protein [Planctomycetota bacterium]
MKKAFVVALSLAALSLLAFAAARAGAEEAKSKVLIVTGFDVGAHNWRKTTDSVRAALDAAGRFDVKVCEDVGIFESTSLAGYDVIVLNYGFWDAPELSAKGREGLLEFAKNGKGIVALHFACSAFQEWDEYKTLLGRIWKKGVGGHGPRGKFTVKIKNSEHPILHGLKDFEADDELYAKLTGDAPVDVLASAYSEWSQREEPIIYVKTYGKGRVVHNVLGHDVAAREAAPYPEILRRCVEWAATGAVRPH